MKEIEGSKKTEGPFTLDNRKRSDAVYEAVRPELSS